MASCLRHLKICHAILGMDALEVFWFFILIYSVAVLGIAVLDLYSRVLMFHRIV